MLIIPAVTSLRDFLFLTWSRLLPIFRPAGTCDVRVCDCYQYCVPLGLCYHHVTFAFLPILRPAGTCDVRVCIITNISSRWDLRCSLVTNISSFRTCDLYVHICIATKIASRCDFVFDIPAPGIIRQLNTQTPPLSVSDIYAG